MKKIFNFKKRRHTRPEFGALFFFDEKRFEAAVQHCSAQERTSLFKTALAAGDSHLAERFNEGEDIYKLVRDRSAFIDRIIYYVWDQFEWDEGISLVAVGGYGRGEMHPHSDIDLLFLLRRNNPDRYKTNISEFLTLLWDLQLTIGHSVRTIKQCAATARADLTVMTNLLESRTIVGPTDLGDKLSSQVYKYWTTEKFFVGKIDEQKARHAKHGITEFDLEPNVKESPGGLRDIQTIHWVAKRTYQVSGLEKLAGRGFYTEVEYNSLRSAETFLWRVRFGLHMLTGRMHDHLQFEHQRQLAEMFGFKDTQERRAVEQFMQKYYRSVTVVREINDVLTQVLEESILDMGQSKITPINARFQLRGKYLEATGEKTFKEHPSAMLEAFVLLARENEIEGIHARTIRQLREYCHLIDDRFRASELNRRLFVELLKSADNIAVPLQKMSRYAVLGRYLPEFGKIIGLTQHDLFHIYPVDIHTLAVIRNITNFGKPEFRETYPVSSYTYASYPKPEILIVAGMYHDIGKGRGGDHSELGAIEVKRFAKEHGFSKSEVRLMAWLVENHLFMSSVAQREDISDPEVIANFARHVGNETRLNLLYTLTSADILATNPTLWNNWRASLMRQLYNATKKALANGLDSAVDQQEIVHESKETAREKLNKKQFADAQIDAVWAHLDNAYFLRESPDDICWHTELLVNYDRGAVPTVKLKPYVNYHRERATVVFVRTQKSPYLFYRVATAIGNANLNIQDVRLYSTADSSFLTVYVLDADANPLSKNKFQAKKLVQTLQLELASPSDDHAYGKKMTPRRLKQLPVPTKTVFRQLAHRSELEVVTADRPGLLATIADVLLAHKVYIRSAKITTLGERVEDLFVIENANGNPIADAELISSVQEEIRKTIDDQVEAISA